MYREFLKHHPRLYQRLILRGALGGHLAGTAMLESVITQMVRHEGITGWLKAEHPMVWVGTMNSIRSRAEEIVLEEVIHTL